ncbi:MAG TPA: M48 family metalloprotease, partial [Longimicrobiales bacterium]|nr:M48 family metalloprotease [Longimicrobiales bacterium]
NAFALPGGFIYVTRGIMTHLTNEAQLVGVLGHEIGHVTARHSVNQMSKQQLAQLGLGVGVILSEDIAAVADIAQAGLQILTLKFSRDDESQADELGVRYMRRIDYDPRQLAAVMEMLQRSSQLQQGSGRVPEWLSTHPDPANRIEHIDQLIAESGVDFSGATVKRAPYLHTIDGMVFGPDPREGFFDGDVFHHPDLRFRIDFPPGWQKANTKTAVQAVSGSEDALLALTLDEGTPASALDRFAAREGVSVGSVTAREINGLSAALAPFSAQVEGGTLRGEVLFVSHRGTTYRFLGYTAEGRWSGYSGTIDAALRSFRPETDPAILSVTPDRLSLVELDRSLPFDTFVDRYPSTVRPEIVALINQVGDNATLAAGTLAKRVRNGG